MSTPQNEESPDVSPVVGTPSVAPIRAEQRQHREEFLDYVLTEAEPWHREHLGRLYEDWERYNETYFAEALVPPYILLSEPSNPRRLGDCSPYSGFGGKSQIRLRPSLLRGTHPHIDPQSPLEGRYRFVTDVLLHETIHQFHQEITGLDDHWYHGHGPAFRDVCNFIGALLGLPPVRDSKNRGKDKELPSCSQWPHNVRPADHYLGAYKQDDQDDSPVNFCPVCLRQRSKEFTISELETARDLINGRLSLLLGTPD
jgi:hypothetical protein